MISSTSIVVLNSSGEPDRVWPFENRIGQLWSPWPGPGLAWPDPILQPVHAGSQPFRKVGSSSGSAKAHGQLKLMDAQTERPPDSTANAMKEILCLFEISVVISYWFMWLICKNNSPKNPFPFKLCFLLPTTMLWVQKGLPTLVLSTKTNSNLVFVFIKMLYVYS